MPRFDSAQRGGRAQRGAAQTARPAGQRPVRRVRAGGHGGASRKPRGQHPLCDVFAKADKAAANAPPFLQAKVLPMFRAEVPHGA